MVIPPTDQHNSTSPHQKSPTPQHRRPAPAARYAAHTTDIDNPRTKSRHRIASTPRSRSRLRTAPQYSNTGTRRICSYTPAETPSIERLTNTRRLTNSGNTEQLLLHRCRIITDPLVSCRKPQRETCLTHPEASTHRIDATCNYRSIAATEASTHRIAATGSSATRAHYRRQLYTNTPKEHTPTS